MAERGTWKTWQLAAASLTTLVLGAGIGAAGARNGGSHASTAAPAPVTTTVPFTTLAPVTTTPPSTTTTLAPTTTRATTGILAPTVSPRDRQLAAMASAFEGVRVRLAEAVRTENRVDVSSVDRLELDQAGPTIILAATSTFTTDRILRDGAWAVTKSMQTFWEAKNIASIPDVIPSFSLTLSTVRYLCPGDFMVRLAQVRASRDDWESTCGS